VEIGTNSRVPTMPSMVHVMKPISPPKGETCLEIIPLLVQIFTIPILVTIIVNQLVEGNEKSDKEHIELVNPSFTILDSTLKSLELISTSVPLTPH